MRSEGRVDSINVGVPSAVRTLSGLSGIDKRPVDGPVRVTAPAAGRSGLAGDAICAPEDHGGPGQAVYAFAREDLDWWQGRLGRLLSNGSFGENLTTVGIDITGARLGERWQIGDQVVLAVTGPRIPCATFALWMDERGWLRSFTSRAHLGAYLRVLVPGDVRQGDALRIVHRPDHDVDIGLAFRALTRARELLPRLFEAGEDLEPELRTLALSGRGFDVDDDPVDDRVGLTFRRHGRTHRAATPRRRQMREPLDRGHVWRRCRPGLRGETRASTEEEGPTEGR